MHRSSICHLLLLPFLTVSALAVPPAHARTEKSKTEETTMLRIICAAEAPKDTEYILASRNDKGEWREHSTLSLRMSQVTGWEPAAVGKLHLAVREGETMVSKCAFTYPKNARRAIVVLLPANEEGHFQADVIDPAKLSFRAGSAMVVNYSKVPGVIMLGKRRVDVKPGGRVVAKPAAEANGMLRMMAAYTDEDAKLVPCYDRYVSASKDARDFLLLLPDPILGLRVFNLPEFGPFE